MNPDAMLALLRTLEQNIHDRGWDGEPSLSVLYDQTDEKTAQTYDGALGALPGPTAYRDTYATRPCAPAEYLASNAVRALFVQSLDFAGMLTGSSLDQFLRDYLMTVLRQPGFLGVVLGFESWTKLVGDVEERLRELSPTRLVDTPGAVERRYLIAADIEGRVYTVTRVWGLPAEGHRTSNPGDLPAPEPLIWGGCAIESVKRLVAAIAEQPRVKVSFFPAEWGNTPRGLPKADLIAHPDNLNASI